MRVDSAEGAFVEHAGRFFEADGMARTSGRMFAQLLLSSEALSLDQLAEKLLTSKAAISANARVLERLGVLERTTHPGDRRDFYAIAPDIADRLLQRRVIRLRRMRELLAEGHACTRTMESAVGDRLARMIEIHTAILASLDESTKRLATADGAARRPGTGR